MTNEEILFLSLLSVIFFAVLAIVLAVLQRRSLTRAVRLLGVCVFLMLMAALYPRYAGGRYALGLTLAESMSAMLLNASPADILEAFSAFSVPYIGAYKAMLLVLLIIAPLFTLGITLSFFSERFTRLLYRVRSVFKDTYLFSAINERALCIAEDIARAHPRAVIVFALRVSREDIGAESLSRIKEIGAYLVSDDIARIGHSLRHRRNYYLLDTDGGENLEAGLRLYRKYSGEHTDKVNMWLYTKSEIAEVIFDRLYETFNIRLINEEALIARALLSRHPLYEAVREGRLSFLLVGGGNIGLEILRTACACSALGEDTLVSIDVIDLDGERAKSILNKTSPELAARFSIRFHSADIKTEAFSSLLDTLCPDYIVVALGSETLNMETSLYIRRKYGNQNGMPKICALIDHKSIDEQILPHLSVADWRYDGAKRRFESTPIASFDITTFGSYEETYKDLRIGADYLDCLAVAVNAASRGILALGADITPAMLTDLYNQVCFYKNYSDAYALSIPYKLFLLGLTLTPDGEGDVSLLLPRIEENLPLLRRHENERYEACMRAGGWTQMPPEDFEKGRMSDKLMKKYARLEAKHTEALSALTGRDFKAEDEKTLLRLPAVITLANALYGKAYSVREKK